MNLDLSWLRWEVTWYILRNTTVRQLFINILLNLLSFFVSPFVYFTSFREQGKADILTPYDSQHWWTRTCLHLHMSLLSGGLFSNPPCCTRLLTLTVPTDPGLTNKHICFLCLIWIASNCSPQDWAIQNGSKTALSHCQLRHYRWCIYLR